MNNNLEHLRNIIRASSSFEEARVSIPKLPYALFTKLGGVSRTSVNKAQGSTCLTPLSSGEEHYGIYTERVKEMGLAPDPEWVIRWSLLGDGHIAKPSSDTSNAYYTESHSISQLPLALYKAALLGERLSRVRYTSQLFKEEGPNYFHDDTVQIFSTSYPFPMQERGRVYTIQNLGKSLLTMIQGIDMRSLALWVMDDGKFYSGNRFALSVGITSMMPLEDIKQAAEYLEDTFSVRFTIVVQGDGALIIPMCGKFCLEVATYILPWFSYKVGIRREDCGAELKSESLAISHALDGYTHRLASSWDSLGPQEKEELFMSQVKVSGISFPSPSDSCLQTMLNTCAKVLDGQISASAKANSFPNQFFPHRLGVRSQGRRSPLDTFSKLQHLRKAARMQAQSGDGFSPNNIRNALSMYGAKVVGQFNPAIARYFIEKYSKPGDLVIDPCSGWGGRLCGAVSAGRRYYGVDACLETVRCSQNLIERLNANASVVHGDSSQESMFLGVTGGFGITSPPYFNVEDYSNDVEQSHLQFCTYEAWQEGFLKPMARNVYASLEPGSYFVLNFGTMLGLVESGIEAFKCAGFEFKEQEILSLSVTGGFQRSTKYRELFLPFRKVLK